MPNDFIIKNGLIVDQGGAQITGSLSVSQGITGSLFGTASFATNAQTASFASTASFATNNYPLNSNPSQYLTSSSIEDAIVDGVIDKAPSQNVVFDALATKSTIIIKDLILSSGGGTSNTLVKVYAINGGIYQNGDFFNFIIGAVKTGGGGSGNIRIWVNTINDFATATQIAVTSTSGNNQTDFALERRRAFFSSGILNITNTTLVVPSDVISNITSTRTQITLNPSNNFWIYISISRANGGDTINISDVQISKI